MGHAKRHAMTSRRRSAKRTFGEISKLPSGRFRARFTGPDLNRHSAPTTFVARIDAEAWLVAQYPEYPAYRERYGAGSPLDVVLGRCSYLVDEVSPGTRSTADVALSDGAVVDVLPPCAGGSGEPCGTRGAPSRLASS